MSYKVQVLDAKGKLKKLFTSQMLSKRHWDLFEERALSCFNRGSYNKTTGVLNYYASCGTLML